MPEQHRITPAGTWTLLLVATLTVMASSTIAPSLPRMAQAYADVPDAELMTKLLLTMPALVIGVCAPLAGAFIDRFGRLRLLYVCLLVYGFAGSAGFVLQQLDHILVSRAVLGLAIAGTMTTMTALVGDYFVGEARSRFASRQSATMSFGAVVCVGLGGVLADIDWRLPFLLYLSSLVVLVPVLAFLREPKHAIEHGSSAAASAPVRWGWLALAYFIVIYAVAMFYMTPVQLPFLVRAIGIDAASLAALAIVVSSLCAAGGAALYGRMRRDCSVLAIYAWSFGLMAAGYALIGAVPAYWAVLAGAVLSGTGAGLFFPNSNLWVLSLAPPRLRGRISGGLTAAIFLGQFASPIIAQPAVRAWSLHGAFLATAVSMAIVCVVLALLRDRA